MKFTRSFGLLAGRSVITILSITLFLISTHAATFTVTKTADTNDGVCDADCSLREAIGAANTAASNDIINFDTSVFNTNQTITLNDSENFKFSITENFDHQRNRREFVIGQRQ